MFNAYRPDYEFFNRVEEETVEETLYSIDSKDGNLTITPHKFTIVHQTIIPSRREKGTRGKGERANSGFPSCLALYDDKEFTSVHEATLYIRDKEGLFLAEYDAKRKLEDIIEGREVYEGYLSDSYKMESLLAQSDLDFDWLEKPNANKAGNILGYFKPKEEYPTRAYGECLEGFFCPIKTIEVLSDGTDTISVVLGIDEYQRRNEPIGAIVKGDFRVDYIEYPDYPPYWIKD